MLPNPVHVADDGMSPAARHMRACVDDVGEGGEADVVVAETTGGDAVPGHERAFEGAGARDELGAEGNSTWGSPRTRPASDRRRAPRAKAELDRGAGDAAAAMMRRARGATPARTRADDRHAARGSQGNPRLGTETLLTFRARRVAKRRLPRVDLHSAPRGITRPVGMVKPETSSRLLQATLKRVPDEDSGEAGRGHEGDGAGARRPMGRLWALGTIWPRVHAGRGTCWR